MKKIKIAALVPMRHHSQRVPGKNFRNLAGKPLFHYVLETLMQCPEIQQIAVNTDSEVIQKDIEKNFPEIIVIDRPEKLAGGYDPDE